MERYSKNLFFKAAQIIVQARQGTKLMTESQAQPKNQSWFCLAINDNSEINQEAERTANFAHLSGCSIWTQPLCIEISLKTTEGETLVLETWVLSLGEGADASIRLANTVCNRMGLLLKSLLCVTRALPAYKLSRRQGPETFVMCYRVFSGEHSTSQLGNGCQTCQVGQVVTQVGTISLKVDYRTQMTISPPTSSLGMDPYYVQPILVKSDHFSDLETSSNTTAKLGPTAKPSVGGNLNNNSESSEQAMTSDESQEAMRLFAASPPDGVYFGGNQYTSPVVQRQGRRLHSADHHSSNESLGRKFSFRPRSGTNQSAASDDTDSENLKLGAFAAKRDILSRKISTGIGSGQDGTRDEDDSPLLELFTVDVSDSENADKATGMKASAKLQGPNLEDKMQQMTLDNKGKPTPQTGAIRKINFDEPMEGAQAAKAVPKSDDFVMLDFKTPFSGGARPSSAAADLCQSSISTASDLGIFFKEVATAPNLRSSIVSPLKTLKKETPNEPLIINEEEDENAFTLQNQLRNLNEDLTSYEMSLSEYDNMLRNLDSNSESEFE